MAQPSEELDERIKGFFGTRSRAEGTMPFKAEMCERLGLRREAEKKTSIVGARPESGIKKIESAIDVESRPERPDQFVLEEERFGLALGKARLDRLGFAHEHTHLSMCLAPACAPVACQSPAQVLRFSDIKDLATLALEQVAARRFRNLTKKIDTEFAIETLHL